MVSSVMVTGFFLILLSILMLTFLAGMQHIYFFHSHMHMCMQTYVSTHIRVYMYVHTQGLGHLPMSAQILFEF